MPENRLRLRSIQHPDGTVELYQHTKQGNHVVTTIDKGAGTLAGVTDGIRTVSTYTATDQLIKEVVSSRKFRKLLRGYSKKEYAWRSRKLRWFGN